MVFDGAVPAGTMTTLFIPAAAEYAATEAAALPVDITVAVAKPNSFALEIPTLLLRSFNDPVGRTVSFFRYRLAIPACSPRRRALISGVLPSPSETMQDRSSTGKKSNQRQILRSRLWRMASKSA